MRLRASRGIDSLTCLLIVFGAGSIAASLVVAAVLLAPAVAPRLSEASVQPPGAAPVGLSAAVPADRVATVLYVDAIAGAGGAARSGDRIDVLGYFSHQVTGGESTTRLLLEDVPVLTVERNAAGVALTLAVARDAALLLQEAQMLGARPFVALRSPQPAGDGGGVPASFSDTDLADRLAGRR